MLAVILDFLRDRLGAARPDSNLPGLAEDRCRYLAFEEQEEEEGSRLVVAVEDLERKPYSAVGPSPAMQSLGIDAGP